MEATIWDDIPTWENILKKALQKDLKAAIKAVNPGYDISETKGNKKPTLVKELLGLIESHKGSLTQKRTPTYEDLALKVAAQEDLSQRVTTQESTIEEYKTLLSAATKDQESFEKILKKSKADIQTNKTLLSTATQEKKTLEKELAAQNERSQKEKSANTALRSTIEDNNAVLSTLTQTKIEMERTLAAKEELLQGVPQKSANAALRSTIEENKALLSTLTQTNKDLERSLADNERISQAEKSKNVILRSEIEKNNGRLLIATQTVENLKTKIEGQEKLIAENERLLLNAKQELKTQREKYTGEKKEISSTHAAAITNLEDMRSNQEETYKNQISEIKQSLQKQLTTLNGANEAREAAFDARIKKTRQTHADAIARVKQAADSASKAHATIQETLLAKMEECHNTKKLEQSTASANLRVSEEALRRELTKVKQDAQSRNQELKATLEKCLAEMKAIEQEKTENQYGYSEARRKLVLEHRAASQHEKIKHETEVRNLNARIEGDASLQNKPPNWVNPHNLAPGIASLLAVDPIGGHLNFIQAMLATQMSAMDIMDVTHKWALYGSRGGGNQSTEGRLLLHAAYHVQRDPEKGATTVNYADRFAYWAFVHALFYNTDDKIIPVYEREEFLRRSNAEVRTVERLEGLRLTMFNKLCGDGIHEKMHKDPKYRACVTAARFIDAEFPQPYMKRFPETVTFTYTDKN
jgi:hypothetical protein